MNAIMQILNPAKPQGRGGWRVLRLTLRTLAALVLVVVILLWLTACSGLTPEQRTELRGRALHDGKAVLGVIVESAARGAAQGLIDGAVKGGAAIHHFTITGAGDFTRADFGRRPEPEDPAPAHSLH